MPVGEKQGSALTPGGLAADTLERMENRIERVVVETSQNRIIGDLTLPRDGYRSRLSDFLNRGDLDFIPLANAEVAPITGGELQTRDFIAVGRTHVHLAYHLPAESDNGSDRG